MKWPRNATMKIHPKDHRLAEWWHCRSDQTTAQGAKDTDRLQSLREIRKTSKVNLSFPQRDDCKTRKDTKNCITKRDQTQNTQWDQQQTMNQQQLKHRLRTESSGSYLESGLNIENTRWLSFDIQFTRQGFENPCWHCEACRAIYYAFSKPSLVNLISKYANLVFYLSVFPLFHSSN